MQKPTPIVSSPILSAQLGCEVWLKLEINNPTGSHKDRESALIIEECRNKGITRIGCASTGNFAVSLSYYAQTNGIECHVWLCEETVSAETLAYLEAFGATLHLENKELDELYQLSSEIMAREGIFNANPGSCAAKVAGNRELATELQSQLSDIDYVICCVNNGTHVIGVADAFAGTNTKIIGVYCYSHFASSIAGFHSNEGAIRIEDAVVDSGGFFVEASEMDLQQGVLALQSQGIIAEVSSAAVVGVLPKLQEVSGKRVCCIVTASGLKKPFALKEFLKSVCERDHLAS